MKLRANPWPWAIIFAFALFISGTIGLVVMACAQRADLVSGSYYEQELKFQNQMDRVERTSRLGAEAAIACDAGRHRITVTLPREQIGNGFKGRVLLYRPSEVALDSQFDLRPDEHGRQTLDTAGMRAGLWRVRVLWTAGNQDYFLEQKVVIE